MEHLFLFLRLILGWGLQVIPHASICYYPFWDKLRMKKKTTVIFASSTFLGSAIIYGILGILVHSYVPFESRLITMRMLVWITMLPCIILYFFCIKSYFSQQLFIFSLISTAGLFSSAISQSLVFLFNHFSGKTFDGMPYTPLSLLLLFIIMLLSLYFILIIINATYMPLRDEVSSKEISLLSVISVLFFIIVFITTSFISISNAYDFFIFVFSIVIFISMYYLIFKSFVLFHEFHLARKRLLVSSHQLEIMNSQYDQIKDSIAMSRRIRHDMKHHMTVVKGYLEENKIEEADDYINEFINKSSIQTSLVISEHPILNSVIGYYYALSTDDDVQFEIKINIPDRLNIDNTDLAIILGNLLDNAYRAVLSVPANERSIVLNIVKIGKNMVITLDNTYSGNLAKRGSLYLSTKNNHSGLGIQSVEYLVKKYEGMSEFTNDDKYFHVSLSLSRVFP